MTFLVALILLLGFPSAIHAASVFINSPPVEVKMGEEFLVNASFSATPNKEYFLKIRIGSSSAFLTQGLTNNPANSSPDDWLSDRDTWTKFPKVSTDQAGSWQGSLKSKTASSLTNRGDYRISLRIKALDSTTTYNSLTYPLKVLENSSPTSVTGALASSDEVRITSPPPKVELDSLFEVKGIVKSTPSVKINLKVLLGKSNLAKDMKDGRTQSPEGSWLAWNASWSKFPELSLDSAGLANFALKAKTSSDFSPGEAYLVIRVHDIDKDQNFDSESVLLTVEPAPQAAADNPPDTSNTAFSGAVNSSIPPSSTKNKPSSVNTTQRTSSLNPSQNPSANPKLPSEEKKELKSKTSASEKQEKKNEIISALESLNIASLSSVLGAQTTGGSYPEKEMIPDVKTKGWDRQSTLLLIGGGVVVLIGLLELLRDHFNSPLLRGVKFLQRILGSFSKKS